jgi:Family of unknown function (DUF6459)
MTTSAPQWPGQEEHRAVEARAGEGPALRAVPIAIPQAHEAVPDAEGAAVPTGAPDAAPEPLPVAELEPAADAAPDAVPEAMGRRLQPVRGPTGLPGGRPLKQRRPSGRRNRLVVVRDLADRDVWAARRRARANLPPPAAVTRDIALALLEVEAGCRSATQLERIFSPELWEALEHRIGRRGGPLPSGRSLISVRCQEDAPGLADTVAVVWKGDLVRPVALRLDASRGRWVVTELRWWRNETDTATTPVRDGGSS